MGVRASFKRFTIIYFCSFFFIITIILAPHWVHAEPADDFSKTPDTPDIKHVNGVGDIANGDSVSPPPSTLASPPPVTTEQKFHFFSASVSVVVGIMIGMLFLTFLLLLYAKHCKSGNAAALPGFERNQNSRRPPSSAARKNSGINRVVIESLPIFRFGSLKGEKDGLECAVCLTRFESTEFLRLLPKCKHAFHVECVDTWLDGHSTCPLCRCRVNPEDILLMEDDKSLPSNQPITAVQNDHDPADTDIDIESGTIPESNQSLSRVSGRHSLACERGLLHAITARAAGKGLEQKAVQHKTASHRQSLDSAGTFTDLRRNSEPVCVNCFERPRIDGLLLTHERRSLDRRLEHRIIVSSPKKPRWSDDVQASDLLYLTLDKIDNRSRLSQSSGSRLSQSQLPSHWNMQGDGGRGQDRTGERGEQ